VIDSKVAQLRPQSPPASLTKRRCSQDVELRTGRDQLRRQGGICVTEAKSQCISATAVGPEAPLHRGDRGLAARAVASRARAPRPCPQAARSPRADAVAPVIRTVLPKLPRSSHGVWPTRVSTWCEPATCPPRPLLGGGLDADLAVRALRSASFSTRGPMRVPLTLLV
jgi:hypothetical protein